MRTRGQRETGKRDERHVDPKSRHGAGRSTIKMASRQTDRIFDYYVQGFTLPQIASQLGVTRPAIQTVIRKPEFKERVAQYQSARREAVTQRLEAAAETAALSLLRVARGGEVDQKTGQVVPVDPRVAEVQIKASDSILDRTGFPKAYRGVMSTTAVVAGAVKTGSEVSDEDMERLRSLFPGVLPE